MSFDVAKLLKDTRRENGLLTYTANKDFIFYHGGSNQLDVRNIGDRPFFVSDLKTAYSYWNLAQLEVEQGLENYETRNMIHTFSPVRPLKFLVMDDADTVDFLYEKSKGLYVNYSELPLAVKDSIYVRNLFGESEPDKIPIDLALKLTMGAKNDVELYNRIMKYMTLKWEISSSFLDRFYVRALLFFNPSQRQYKPSERRRWSVATLDNLVAILCSLLGYDGYVHFGMPVVWDASRLIGVHRVNMAQAQARTLGQLLTRTKATFHPEFAIVDAPKKIKKAKTNQEDYDKLAKMGLGARDWLDLAAMKKPRAALQRRRKSRGTTKRSRKRNRLVEKKRKISKKYPKTIKKP
tara:strand:+ start:177 stop:1226 length:1050 start_codon:yes stop_codon:yes gene_type:complete